MTTKEIIAQAKCKTHSEIALIINLLIETLDDETPDCNLEPDHECCDAYEDLGTKQCQAWKNVGFAG